MRDSSTINIPDQGKLAELRQWWFVVMVKSSLPPVMLPNDQEKTQRLVSLTSGDVVGGDKIIQPDAPPKPETTRLRPN